MQLISRFIHQLLFPSNAFEGNPQPQHSIFQDVECTQILQSIIQNSLAQSEKIPFNAPKKINDSELIALLVQLQNQKIQSNKKSSRILKGSPKAPSNY